MGLHYDYRLVVGDKAYSWATKKEMPEPGKSILLFEQPVHTADYALSSRVEIPDGQYGAGVTTLDLAKKAVIGENSTQDQLTIYTKDQKFLLKKLDPVKYGGEGVWLFKQLHTLGGSSGLEKAGKEQGLNAHQSGALDQMDASGGVIVHHSTGSGKSRTFLTAVERAHASSPDARALVVAPASLISNIDKEIKKHGLKIDHERLDALSYEMAANRAHILSQRTYALAVADEAHKLRNTDTKRSQTLAGILAGADKRMLATATGTYNHISDISPLVNIAAGGEKVLPTDRKEMEKRFTKTLKENPGLLARIMGAKPVETQVLARKGELKDVLSKYVHYYDNRDDPKLASKFPTTTSERIEVPMSEEQARFYKFVEGDLPFVLRMKIRNNIPLDKQDKANLNSFSTGVRQASNSYRHLTQGQAQTTPKIKTAVARLQKHLAADKDAKGLVYSNYLDAGTTEYSKALGAAGVKHVVFTGSLSREEKDAAVKSYNAGETPVLLISSSGAEGLDLKGTSLVQVLEPHFNPSKITQVVGRAARYESHEHLPVEKRKVKVEHFASVFEKPMIGKAPYSIDKYLMENSDDKGEMFDQMKALMRTSTAKESKSV
jgi:hypothetical protein